MGNADKQSFKGLTTWKEQPPQSSRVQLTLNGHVSQALEGHLEVDTMAQMSRSSEEGAIAFNEYLFGQVSKRELKAAKISILLQAQSS